MTNNTSADLCKNWNAAEKAARKPLPVDSVGKPIQTGAYYRIDVSGIRSMFVQVSYNEANELIVTGAERTTSFHRVVPVDQIPDGSKWTQIDRFTREIQPRPTVEEANNALCNPLEVLTDDLCRIESRRLLLQGELKRLEHQARLLVGCPNTDGSMLDIAVFNFIYNGHSAESLVTQYEETTLFSMG
jgi:hypothetical protein